MNAIRPSQWVKYMLTINAVLMTDSDNSTIVQLKLNIMMLMDDNTINVIKKMMRKRAYYGAITDKLPVQTHSKARELHVWFKSGGRV
jgi:hypothetical protein